MAQRERLWCWITWYEIREAPKLDLRWILCSRTVQYTSTAVWCIYFTFIKFYSKHNYDIAGDVVVHRVLVLPLAPPPPPPRTPVPLMCGHRSCTDTFAWSRWCPFMTGTTVHHIYCMPCRSTDTANWCLKLILWSPRISDILSSNFSPHNALWVYLHTRVSIHAIFVLAWIDSCNDESQCKASDKTMHGTANKCVIDTIKLSTC